MTLAEKITALQNAKDAIADAITGMGGTVSAGDGFADFAEDIATIPSGGDVTDGIMTTYTGNNITKIDIYCSHDTYDIVIPTMYKKDTVTQAQFHLKNSPEFSLGAGCFNGCSSLVSIEIPNGATSLESECFKNCSSLVSIDIPSSVRVISTFCFNGCSSLVSITIPDGVKTLDTSCFNGCSSLASITIPVSITLIGSFCFSNCTGLTEIHFKRSTPATVSNSNAWNKVPTTCKIYVPTGSLDAYIAAANYPSASTYTYIEE